MPGSPPRENCLYFPTMTPRGENKKTHSRCCAHLKLPRQLSQEDACADGVANAGTSLEREPCWGEARIKFEILGKKVGLKRGNVFPQQAATSFRRLSGHAAGGKVWRVGGVCNPVLQSVRAIFTFSHEEVVTVIFHLSHSSSRFCPFALDRRTGDGGPGGWDNRRIIRASPVIFRFRGECGVQAANLWHLHARRG